VATITTADFRPGVVIKFSEGAYVIVTAQHTHTARGSATVRVKMRNVLTGSIIDRTFQAKEKVEQAFVDRTTREYLYRDGDLFYFMDPESFEQEALGMDVMEDVVPYLKENVQVTLKILEGQVIDVELPDHVDLKIVETEPGLRGDTVSGATKPAKLETGAVTQVPLFIENGEVIKVDTRTGDYLSRVGKS